MVYLLRQFIAPGREDTYIHSMLVDSHCHLDFPDFAEDLEQVIGRARLRGIGTMLTISTKLSSFHAVRAVAERLGLPVPAYQDLPSALAALVRESNLPRT